MKRDIKNFKKKKRMKNFKNLACRFGLSLAKKIATYLLVAYLFLVASVTDVKAQTVSFPDFTEQENKKINEYIMLVKKYGDDDRLNTKSIFITPKIKLSVIKSNETIISIGITVNEKLNFCQTGTIFSFFMKPNEKANFLYNMINGFYTANVITDEINKAIGEMKSILNNNWMSEQEIVAFKQEKAEIEKLKTAIRKKMDEEIAILMKGDYVTDIIVFRTKNGERIVCTFSVKDKVVTSYNTWSHSNDKHNEYACGIRLNANIIEYLQKSEIEIIEQLTDKETLTEGKIMRKALGKAKSLNPNNEDKSFLSGDIVYTFKNGIHKLSRIGTQTTIDLGKSGKMTQEEWEILSNWNNYDGTPIEIKK